MCENESTEHRQHSSVGFLMRSEGLWSIPSVSRLQDLFATFFLAYTFRYADPLLRKFFVRRLTTLDPCRPSHVGSSWRKYRAFSWMVVPLWGMIILAHTPCTV